MDIFFSPFFLFKSAFQQTLMGALFYLPSKVKSKTKFITLKDKDKIAVEVSKPKNWEETDLSVVLVHGLGGSHNSSILVRMAKRLYKRNIRVIRLNLRNCGSGRGLSQKTCHGVDENSIIEVLEKIKEENPNSPIVLIGFSWGGNLVLKTAGVLKDLAKKYLKEVIALSPPVDLSESVSMFNNKENKVYYNYFFKLLKEDINFMKKNFPNFPKIEIKNSMSIEDFNSEFTVPFFNFESLEDYYQKASSKYFISDIKIPSKILFSKDDPIISYKSLDDIDIPENVEIFTTEHGGHLGYISNLRDKKGFFWLDNLLIDWILKK